LSTDTQTTLLVVLALLGAACRHEPATQALGALCRGADVQAPVRLVIDSTRPAAGEAAGKLAGQGFNLELAFRPGETRSECNGRTGRVAFEGKLPPELASAAASDHVGLWRVTGDTVAVDLNPSARDNNLTLVLPLSGGLGRWGLSTLVGEVIAGSVAPR
jgi:hypothetical protein